MKPVLLHRALYSTQYSGAAPLSFKQNYLRAETLVKANTRLVDYQFTLPLAQKLGVVRRPLLTACGLLPRYERYVQAPTENILAPVAGSLGNNLISDQYSVVPWNTIYMQAALAHLRDEGEVINEKDEVRLSPLRHAHINMLEHYTFMLLEQ